jgi:hypothetical protein
MIICKVPPATSAVLTPTSPETDPAAHLESAQRLPLSMGGALRVFVWGFALFLTAAILLYPVDLRLVDSPIQSVNIIDNLPLFGIAYYIWLFTILVLLFSKAGPTANHWEKTTLVILFAVVFWGFWTINTPEGQSEELYFLAYTKHLADTGHIGLSAGNLTYFDFPGLSLFGYSVSSIVGLSHLNTRTLIMLFNAVLMALFLYHLYERFSDSADKPTGLYLLAVPLVVQGNMMLSIGFFFRPENALGLLLLMTLLVLLAANRDESTFFGRRRNNLVAIVVFAALMITHFLTSVAFIAILGGLYSVRLANGQRTPPLSTIGLLLVMVGAWALFHAGTTFTNIVSLGPYFVSLVKRGEIFFYIYTLGVANAGGDVPLWASAVRLFWLVAVYVLAGLLALLNLTRLQRLDGRERDYSGALLGIGVMAVIAALVGGTGDQASRYVEYGGFFAVPIVLAFMSRAVPQRLRVALVLPAFFLLSLPTFLAYHGRVTLNAFYPAERRSAEFLVSHSPRTEEDLNIFTGTRELYYYSYYLPKSTFKLTPWGVQKRADIQFMWNSIDNLVAAFVTRSSIGARENAVFTFSQAFPLTYQHLNGISSNDPRWLGVKARLADTNLFYNNGHVQMYLPR